MTLSVLTMKSLLENKYILLDTCVLIFVLKNASLFKNIFDRFSDNGCRFCMNDFVRLELIRGARNRIEKDRIENLDSFLLCLQVVQEIYKVAEELSSLYNYCSSVTGMKQISMVDIINASFLKKYSDDLFLFTLDNNDYPLEIFDRIEVGAIDSGKQILTWGIYRFNCVKFGEKARRFEDGQ